MSKKLNKSSYSGGVLPGVDNSPAYSPITTILKGLQELKDKEHIKSYSYEEATGMYRFTYSNKYVRHSENKKQLPSS